MTGGGATRDRLGKMSRIAALREERALRAWRAANVQRDACAAARDEAERIRELASARAAEARSAAMDDPCSEQAWIWTAATRAAHDDRRAASIQAEQAHDDAALRAVRRRDDHRRSEARTSTIDERSTRARRTELRRREDRQAEDAAPAPKGRA